MVGRGEGNAICHMVRTSVGSNRQDVCSIDQAELYPCYRALVAIGEKNLLSEAGEASQPVYLLNDPSARRGQDLNLLRSRRLES